MQYAPVRIVLVHNKIQKNFIEPSAETAKGKFNGVPADIGEYIVFQQKFPLSKNAPSIRGGGMTLMRVLPVLRQLQAGCRQRRVLQPPLPHHPHAERCMRTCR